MLRLLTISALCLFLSQAALGQESDTTDWKDIYRPTGIRFGTDLISLAKIPFSDQFDGWEVAADVDFYKYYLTAEVGSWQKTFVSPDQSYSNSGNYFRIGTDVNLLLKDPERNMFFLGLRYAHSKFSEQLSYSTDDPVFGPFQQVSNNSGMKAGWGEVTLGLRVKIWKLLWMGYTARLKVAPTIGTESEFEPYDIPGYGLATKSTYWGFNYQLYWRIPLRKSILPEE